VAAASDAAAEAVAAAMAADVDITTGTVVGFGDFFGPRFAGMDCGE